MIYIDRWAPTSASTPLFGQVLLPTCRRICAFPPALQVPTSPRGPSYFLLDTSTSRANLTCKRFQLQPNASGCVWRILRPPGEGYLLSVVRRLSSFTTSAPGSGARAHCDRPHFLWWPQQLTPLVKVMIAVSAGGFASLMVQVAGSPNALQCRTSRCS